jgi:hypothetical protein
VEEDPPSIQRWGHDYDGILLAEGVNATLEFCGGAKNASLGGSHVYVKRSIYQGRLGTSIHENS